ncbi:MAG: hypothetical protein JXA33_05650 [Anaerolineae bacterium]|nr:hypothetical protein [Anaerolineae bacterium]
MMTDRKLPRFTFQVMVLLLLLVSVGVWLRWILWDSGPYAWLRAKLVFLGQRESQLLGGLLAFLLAFVFWVAPTMILRLWTDLPPLSEALSDLRGHSLVEVMREEVDAQREQQAKMADLPGDDPRRRAFFRRLGWVGIGVGIGALGVTWLVWYLSGNVWPESLVMGLVGVVGGLLSVLTGHPLLFHYEKVMQLETLTRRIGWVVILLLLLGLSLLCVWDIALR